MKQEICFIKNICKQLNGNIILSNISLQLNRGEIHTVIGHNAEGKSTLMSVIAGMTPYDSGEIYIDGKKANMYNRAQAEAMGISYMKKDSILIPEMSVLDNVFLGRYPTYKFSKVLDYKTATKRAEEVFEILNFTVDLDRRVNTFGTAEQRIIELARILCCQSNVLILDEVDLGLNEVEIGCFYQALLLLKKQGVSILFASQDLQKALEVSDQVTMIYKGEISWSMENNHDSPEVILNKINMSIKKQGYSKMGFKKGDEILRVDNLGNNNALSGVNFVLNKGEILGLIGKAGAGRTSLARCLFGLDHTCIGAISVRGEEVSIRNPLEAINLKIGFIEETADSSLVPTMTSVENITLANIDGMIINRAVDLKSEAYKASYFLERLGFKREKLHLPVKSLSLGEKKKVIIAKCLFSDTKIFLLDEPTMGLDISSKVSFYSLISELTSKGASCILISSDVDELVGVCDRVLLIGEGAIKQEYLGEDMNVENIIKGMSEKI